MKLNPAEMPELMALFTSVSRDARSPRSQLYMSLRNDCSVSGPGRMTGVGEDTRSSHQPYRAEVSAEERLQLGPESPEPRLRTRAGAA